jgi:hypothetical protein
LIESLRALADDGAATSAGHPPSGEQEQADAFADAYLLASTCQQVQLTAHQRETLDHLDQLLERAAPERTIVQTAARAALKALGYDLLRT